jgi:hypothetical protein
VTRLTDNALDAFEVSGAWLAAATTTPGTPGARLAADRRARGAVRRAAT